MKTDGFVSELIDTLSDPTSRIRVVSLLANGNPIGIIFAALFMGAMTSGSIAVEMFGGVPKAMTGILLGVIIMIITVKFVPDFQKRKKSKKKENKPC